MAKQKNDHKAEFGDFQTPDELARKVCDFLQQQGVQPASVLEPTCGLGHFLSVAVDTFPQTEHFVGFDINPHYVKQASLALQSNAAKITVSQADFFEVDWGKIISDLPEPLLIIGNPPWVTNADLTTLESANLPQKNNEQNLPGLAAKTGKSNFDISEWMLTHLLEQLNGRSTILAMLCKTSVARKVMATAWKNKWGNGRFSLHLIDAPRYFNAAVDACLLVYNSTQPAIDAACPIYDDLATGTVKTTVGFRDGRLLANIPSYKRWQHLHGQTRPYRWRSGVKHDAAKIMELTKDNDGYENGLGHKISLEGNYLYPMLKSSDLAQEVTPSPSRWMLIPQRTTGEQTLAIKYQAPQTWAYLLKHSAALNNRKSSIYKNRPPFSIFGVGNYTFAPWKVAISGLYKQLHFAVVGPYDRKPVVFDDTCYFIAVHNEKEARFLAHILNSEIARQFYQSFIFWDAKRPITIEILKQLDLFKLAQELEMESQMQQLATPQKSAGHPQQLALPTF